MAAALQSEVGIASAALMHLGRDPIASFDDAGSTNATILKERYPAVRDRLLRTYPWNFAMRFASIAGSKLETPQFGFTHKCALPAGGDLGHCLKLWRVDKQGVKFQVVGRDLYTNFNPPVPIAYVISETNPELFDPLFAELLALELALTLITRIASGDARKSRRDLTLERRRILREARLSDAMEQSPAKMGSHAGASWADARRPL